MLQFNIFSISKSYFCLQKFSGDGYELVSFWNKVCKNLHFENYITNPILSPRVNCNILKKKRRKENAS